MFSMENGTLQITQLPANAWQRAVAFLNISGIPYTADEQAYLKEALEQGRWAFFMASINGQDVGAGYLNRTPLYRPYAALKIPEFQDLRVLTPHRNQGIGRALVEAAEAQSKREGAGGMGLSVGLTADYGAAQRLYARLGYIPDGHGITVERKTVQKGERIIIDDDLCLMLLKLFKIP